jgi:sec-independent protein translocase protein TatB
MPSFQDSVVIFFIALLIFGPKKLPELARQLGKLMSEFRRASNEFRMQMEDELRIAEQAEQQKKIAAMEAAAPVTHALPGVAENSIAAPPKEDPLEVHPHELPPEDFTPRPIATSGELNIMPPSTGLPVANSSNSSAANSAISHAFDSVPHVPAPEPAIEASTDEYAAQQIPNRTPDRTPNPSTATTPAEPATEASLHG